MGHPAARVTARFDPNPVRNQHRHTKGKVFGSLQGFLAPEVDGHQNLDGNAAAAVAEIVDAEYFTERFAVERARSIGIGISDKQAHAFRVELVLRNKIHAVARSVQSRQDFVEVMQVSAGRPHANSLWKPEPRFAPALGASQSCHSRE